MIGKLLGHTQVQTTARYAHLARDSLQTAAARITGSIGGDLSPLDTAPFDKLRAGSAGPTRDEGSLELGCRPYNPLPHPE